MVQVRAMEPTLASEHAKPCIVTRDLSAFFGDTAAIRSISSSIPQQAVTAIIGPSGCGKSTFLRCLNRMHETVPTARVTGRVFLEGEDIYRGDVSAVAVRRRVGMVFQRPTPFPTMSVRDNVAAGLRVLGDKRPNRRAVD